MALDFNASKTLKLSGTNVQLFFKVFNLLDRDNPVNVFGDTGLADFTLREARNPGAAATWFTQPGLYSEPRRVQVGARISIN